MTQVIQKSINFSYIESNKKFIENGVTLVTTVTNDSSKRVVKSLKSLLIKG